MNLLSCPLEVRTLVIPLVAFDTCVMSSTLLFLLPSHFLVFSPSILHLTCASGVCARMRNEPVAHASSPLSCFCLCISFMPTSVFLCSIFTLAFNPVCVLPPPFLFFPPQWLFVVVPELPFRTYAGFALTRFTSLFPSLGLSQTALAPSLPHIPPDPLAPLVQNKKERGHRPPPSVLSVFFASSMMRLV